jgi:ankyrin repeat protein
MQILAPAAILLFLAGCRDSESQTVTEQQTDIPIERVTPPDVSLPDAAWDGNIEAVKQHIAAGSDLNQKNASGTTPIENAATSGQPDVVRVLIEAGADVNSRNDEGGTPLHRAWNR